MDPELSRALEGMEHRLAALHRETVAELASLVNLHAVLPLKALLPPQTGFTASAVTISALVREALGPRPTMTVVECGSGSSTVWLAAACRERGRGRVVALEHDPDYGEQTGAALAANGLTDHAEVRVAGLEPLELDGETFQWYARGAWSDLTGIDLLFVDGPPGATGPHARYPALPVFAPGLQDDAVVVLDDTVRAEEAEILRRWQELRLAGGHLGRARPTGRASQARWHRSDEAG